jgi:hypothetical protein
MEAQVFTHGQCRNHMDGQAFLIVGKSSLDRTTRIRVVAGNIQAALQPHVLAAKIIDTLPELLDWDLLVDEIATDRLMLISHRVMSTSLHQLINFHAVLSFLTRGGHEIIAVGARVQQ